MIYDIAIIGGGINGVGTALEAASRGLTVILCEQDDLASGTSSKSSKLIHGGLRYLEHSAFGLVRESLQERETLLNIAGHMVEPIPFIIPYEKNLRSDWMIRLGLYCYDFLNINSQLEKSKSIRFNNFHEDSKNVNPIKRSIKKAFQYADCVVDDARLVVMVARLAAQLGATIMTRSKCVEVKCDSNQSWSLGIKEMRNPASPLTTIHAKVLVNASGPWIKDTLDKIIKLPSNHQVKKVKGSHLIVPKLHEQKQAYLLQHHDGRVVFTIPYLKQYTIIGTTDISFEDDPQTANITTEEIEYLCKVVNQYFHHPLKEKQIIATWAGVRALWDNGSVNPSQISRDCKIDAQLNASQHPPLINIFGGKLTTYRSMGEKLVNHLKIIFPQLEKSCSKQLILPGSMPYNTFDNFLESAEQLYAFVPSAVLHRLARNYGYGISEILKDCRQFSDLGEDFGHGLTQREIAFLIEHEWAQTYEDILWRRTKLGLIYSNAQIKHLSEWLNGHSRFKNVSVK